MATNQTKRLEEMFPDAKKLTTRAGAARRIIKVQGFLHESGILHFVYEFQDGFLPIAVLNDNNGWCMMFLIDAGFGVTNP